MRHIITIGREFGSGGRELGRRLSDELQIAYYDQEIISEVAKRTALSEAYVGQFEETRPITVYPIHVRNSFYSMPAPSFQQDVSIYVEQHRLLEELSGRSDCIIVGRCTDYIRSVFFVYADTASKLQRCMERRSTYEMLTDTQMQQKIMEIDRNHAKYYGVFTGQKWDSRENYDLLVNSSCTDIKLLSAAIAGFLRVMLDRR